MEHVSKLVKIVEGPADSTTNSASTPSKMPREWVAVLFAKLQGRYGTKFMAQFEGIERVAMDEWAQVLSGIAGEQIATGLRLWQEDWPPSLPEFRNACLGKTNGKNEFGLDYIPEYHREQPKVDRSHMLSSDQRDAKRAKNLEQVAKMREALKGHP